MGVYTAMTRYFASATGGGPLALGATQALRAENEGDELLAGMHAELRVNAGHVGLRRAALDGEVLGDERGASSLGEQAEHLVLPSRQLRLGGMPG